MPAVRVPPSACRTSQSMAMLFSPRAARSIEARSERPMSRLISWVRPPIRPLTDSRSLRVWVARGSIEYSAVTQPSPDPLRHRGTPSVTLAADGPADVGDPTADPALDRLAVAAGVGGPRQHRVLGGHPAQPRPLAPSRHALGDARGAQHAGAAELDEHRALGVVEPVAGDRHGGGLVGRAAGGAGDAGRGEVGGRGRPPRRGIPPAVRTAGGSGEETAENPSPP